MSGTRVFSRDTLRLALEAKHRLAYERFWTKTDRSGDCWEWTGNRLTRGYGVIVSNGRRFLAHRVAYERAIGPIPDGLLVRHSCDNPPCINPAHLLVGTDADNVRDMFERGRARCRKGAQHPRARLTDQDVLQIRLARAQGVSGQVLADRFGVSRGSIYHAAVGRTWRHLPLGAR